MQHLCDYDVWLTIGEPRHCQLINNQFHYKQSAHNRFSRIQNTNKNLQNGWKIENYFVFRNLNNFRVLHNFLHFPRPPNFLHTVYHLPRHDRSVLLFGCNLRRRIKSETLSRKENLQHHRIQNISRPFNLQLLRLLL